MNLNLFKNKIKSIGQVLVSPQILMTITIVGTIVELAHKISQINQSRPRKEVGFRYDD
jgi:hypothetical protein